MTRYDFLMASSVLLSTVRTDYTSTKLDFGNFLCELGQLMTRNDFLEAR